MDDESRAMRLMNLCGGLHSYQSLLGLVKKHPQKDDDNALAEVILDESFLPEEWMTDDDVSGISEDDSIEYQNTGEDEEDLVITKQLIGILGEMYDRNKVLAIVRTHPNKYNIEEVMATVLDNISVETVDSQWLRNASSGIEKHKFGELEEKKEEEEISGEEIWRESYYKFEEEVTEAERYKRTTISDLLATKSHRELAFDVIELLNEKRLKYTLNTILCVLRHHSTPEDIHSVVETIERGIDIQEWYEKDKQAIDNLPKYDCVICYMEYPKPEMYKVRCDESHQFCYECLQGSIKSSLGEGEIPMCPWGGCDHVMTEREVIHIFGEGEWVNRFSRTLLQAGLASLENCVGCPTPGCENWLVLPDTDSKVKCPCDLCHKDFCSLCKKLYHYQTTCVEMQEFTVKWIKWVENREENIGKVKEITELQQRLQELEKDEAWKRANLRCCPKCGRPIEKIDGCNAMKCGKDYHGGNKQKGCGKSFRWTKALPYNPPKDSTQHLLDKVILMKKNENVLGYGENGVYAVCDICHEMIEGVGFMCLNCPCFNICEQCESKMDHDPNHIMRVLGIEFIEEELQEKRSLLSRLRKAVKRKKKQLIGTESDNNESKMEEPKKNKVKRGLFG